MKTKDGRFYIAIPLNLTKSFTRMSGDEVKQAVLAAIDTLENGTEPDDDMSTATGMAYDVIMDMNNQLLALMEKNRAARQKASNARWHP